MTYDELFDGSDAHLLHGNAALIERLRHNPAIELFAEAADALEAADKRIAELESEVKHYMSAFDKAFDQAMKNGQAANEAERKLAMAREAIQQTIAENGHLADGEVCTLKSLKEALAQIGGDDEQT